MFPDEKCPNIGDKLYNLNKNIFLNDYLYEILENVIGAQNKAITREYFNLNDEDFENDEDEKSSNSSDSESGKTENLNPLFMANVDA